MTNLIKLVMTGLVGLLATRSCTATPLHNSDIERRGSSDDIDWEELFGAGNRPAPGHLLQAHAAFEANRDQLDGNQALLIGQGATMFWATLHVVVKSNPDGKAIRRMFSRPANNPILTVALRADQSGYSHEDVNTDELPDWMKQADSPLWPFVLAEAAFKYGWIPKSPGQNDDLDSGFLFTSFSQIETETVARKQGYFDSPGDIWPWIQGMDSLPTVFKLESIGYFAALEVTNAAERRFKIGLFPFLDTLESQEITIQEFHDKFHPLLTIIRGKEHFIL